jgi:inhibitor of KinA sporulation pathway (predicted exonuclease)
MNILSLDLELNKHPTQIIQVGMVVGSLQTGEILEKVGCFIKISNPLDPFITSLTNITEDDLRDGGSILDAYNELIRLKTQYQCYGHCLQWGGGDIECLQKEITLTSGDMSLWPFGHRYVDAKTVFQTLMIANDKKPQAGLAKALTKLGLQFKGSKHNAVDDAYNTFVLYYNILNRLKGIV